MSAEQPGGTTHLGEGRHNVNRHLNNLLSSAKLYIDQTAHALSEEFGRGSDIYQRYRASTSGEYDASLAYRALEAMRGYVQHRGLPTHSISFASRRDETDSNRIRNRHLVTFGLVPESVREDGGFKSSVLGELEEAVDKEGRIELMPLIRDYVSGIARVHKSVRMSVSAELDKADNFVASLFERVYSLTGHRCVSARIWETTIESMNSLGGRLVPIGFKKDNPTLRKIVMQNIYRDNMCLRSRPSNKPLEWTGRLRSCFDINSFLPATQGQR